MHRRPLDAIRPVRRRRRNGGAAGTPFTDSGSGASFESRRWARPAPSAPRASPRALSAPWRGGVGSDTADMPITPEAVQMARFLHDVVAASERSYATVAAQTKTGSVSWCAIDSRLAGVESPFLSSESTVFLRVARPDDPPRPPEEPAEDELDPMRLDEHERAVRDYEERLKEWEQHQKLYADLFAARALDDSHEVVAAIGLLIGRQPENGAPLRRHLVAAPCAVDLDPKTGTIEVSTVDTFRVEKHWLDGHHRTRIDQAAGQLGQLADVTGGIDATAATAELVHALGTSARHVEHHDWEPPADDIGLGACPAVLVRTRESSALLDLLEQMLTDMSGAGQVSEPYKMLLSESYEPGHLEVRSPRAALPLDANEEQRELIDRARRERHLVIQGPPGTGKTHTIANLVAVLLAEGRRVLVTAQNERALQEVQTKLPPSMQNLLLPMFRTGGSGALEASVNDLLTRGHSSSAATEQRRADLERLTDDLERAHTKLRAAEDRLRHLASLDLEERTLSGVRMRLDGHLRALASRSDDLALVDRFLSPSGRLDGRAASDLLELTERVGEEHRLMVGFSFPTSPYPPETLHREVTEIDDALSALADPAGHDHSVLAPQREELSELQIALQYTAPTPWPEITYDRQTLLGAADRAGEAATRLSRTVAFHPVPGVPPGPALAHAIQMLEQYLALDAGRFDVPIAQLVTRHDDAVARCGPTPCTLLPDAVPEKVDAACLDIQAALRKDSTGLLPGYLAEQAGTGQGPLTRLLQAARDLPDATAEMGLPVVIDADVAPLHELLAQAVELRDHLADGGKMAGPLRAPRPVRDAAPLIGSVSVNGSRIDTLEEAGRAVQVLTWRVDVTIIEAWAQENGLTIPADTPATDWVAALKGIDAAATDIQHRIRSVTAALDHAPVIDAESLAEVLVQIRSAAAAAIAAELLALRTAAAEARYQLTVAGHPVRNRDDAKTALDTLRALTTRIELRKMLPPEWQPLAEQPLDVAKDTLALLLHVAAVAATVPEWARHGTLTPSTVGKLQDQVVTDCRRQQLLTARTRVLEAAATSLAVAGTRSPATQAAVAALQGPRYDSYADAVRQITHEKALAATAASLAGVRAVVRDEHPRLLEAFDAADPDAILALENVEQLQQVRDRRDEVQAWQTELERSADVHRTLTELHQDFRRAEARLAEARCWDLAIERISGDRALSSALSALTIALDGVPKTKTAKSYPRKLRALKDATASAAPAIPCWVLTIDRVAEVLGYPTGNSRFDVVIVDEASQAWFSAMFLYAIADQVVIVGDNLQVSPSRSSGAEAQMRSIGDELLPGHRISNQVGDDLSLYDVALTMTSPSVMVDHFRCVPEIIELSNRLSYGPKGKRLLPSRVRSATGLEPVRYCPVPGAQRGSAGTGANTAEAEAVAAAVAQCHADPAYAGMTFGVVAVGSHDSAHLRELQSRILRALGPAAAAERNLEIGTSAQFQGAERDVMFLSLIDTPRDGGRIRLRPLEHSGRNRFFVQQLNVAVSRARDQLWIFHSFLPDDLDPRDARVVLFDAPAAQSADLAAQLSRCDSKFERDVVSAIAGRSEALGVPVTVRTQVEAIGYKIDIVVQDHHGRQLAVECDGDRWHSEPEAVRADLHRQRILEGIGWNFYRFLASEWYADPEEHLDAIFDALGAVGPPNTPTPPDPKPAPPVDVPDPAPADRLADSATTEDPAVADEDPTPPGSP